MKKIPLTKGFVALVDDDDYEVLKQYNWRVQYAKKCNRVCAIRGEWRNGKLHTVYMHRQILGVTDTHTDVDHINHNAIDNQRTNLRVAVGSQNLGNRRRLKRGVSRFKGVSYSPMNTRRKWVAGIADRQRSKTRSIGCFETELAAAIAYNVSAHRKWGEFSLLNNVAAAFDPSAPTHTHPPRVA